MQSSIRGWIRPAFALFFLSLVPGCYKCYTSAGCSASFSNTVNTYINNNPSIIDYDNRKALCESAQNTSTNLSWTNGPACTVTWGSATN